LISNLSFAFRRFSVGFYLGIAVFCQNASHAEEAVDVVEYFVRSHDARGAGLARKSKPIDVRPAKPEEVIVTMIKGEGKETQSPPAKSGDKQHYRRQSFVTRLIRYATRWGKRAFRLSRKISANLSKPAFDG
jgi:hypothetical protein